MSSIPTHKLAVSARSPVENLPLHSIVYRVSNCCGHCCFTCVTNRHGFGLDQWADNNIQIVLIFYYIGIDYSYPKFLHTDRTVASIGT